MKIARNAVWGLYIAIFLVGYAFAQQAGDYRSATNGNWSDAATWETFDGSNWVPAASAPTGTENITIVGEDSVRVDVGVSVTGYVTVADTGVVEVTTGTLAFEDGSTYEHARDEGSIPLSTWNTGSTMLLTGTVGTAPENRNQSYYNITLNTPNLSSNRDLSLDDVVIGGDIRVVNSGSARWRLTSVSGGDTAIVTLMGDMIVEGGSFETQGTGNALTTFIVHHYGNINVTGGTFSISRGSQGNGSGTTTWYLHQGNFSMSDAETRNSNPTPGNAKFVFAGADTQQITFANVTYGGGDIHFEVSDSSTMQVMGDLGINGLLVNKGTVDVVGTLTFLDDGAVYEHARDGGSVPISTWGMGSTALFTGITTSTPDNRGQDYYNLTLNTSGLLSNRDMSLDGRTISGDLRLIESGSSRWRLVGGSSGTVTIMGNVYVEGGSLETQGTSSPTDVVVEHYGNIEVTGGTFAISRGSQGGVGTTKWYLRRGNFSISDATTRNSNTAGATFIFANDSAAQSLTLTNVTYESGGLPVQVDSAATLDMGINEIGGEGNFVLSDNATLATGHPNGLDGTLQTTGSITISPAANIVFNGTVAQVAGALLPDSLASISINNAAGVAFNDTVSVVNLMVSAGSNMLVDSLGSVTADAGTVAGTVVNRSELEATGALTFEDGSVYEHARDEGSIPTGDWQAGSTLLLTGITGAAPGNRNQNYYNITINTPNLASNRDLGLDDVTIGGDIRVVDTGGSRWRLTSASGGDTAIVTIMGDVIVENGAFETQGTGNALTVFEVHHYGDVLVSGGNFSVARGSQGSGSGSTRWYMHRGNFNMSGATTQNSNPTNAWFVFNSDSVQNISLSGVTYGGGGLAVEVADGATLDFGLSELGGNGLFVLNANATLATANSGGVDSTLQTSGDIILSTGANFTFNGTATQVTNAMMPDTVNTLTIASSDTVKLSQETRINGVLRLVAGVFDNTVPFTLGPNGSISFEGGELLIPVGIGDEPIAELPKVFALHQNYPNPFNPSTTIRYDVPRQTHVSLRVYDILGRLVAELVNDPHAAGTYSTVWNAKDMASGIYYYRITAGDFVSVRKLMLMK